ncbi:cell wall hydrolase [Sphingobium sp.]|uniref:cell wall hydrolase n=1 Tax=Sphingobium sp. TaxID=1912891 RepID=UPI0026228DBB|nr:cell wall hydrolase [Sphingobium sp.]
MTDISTSSRLHAIAMGLVWALLFVGLPFCVAGWESRHRPADAVPAAVAAARIRRPATPPPPVEPVQVYALERDQAVALNAAIPFSRDPNPAARPFLFSGTETDLARATDCLAAAELYEAGDDAVGEQAVAQVVLNRVRHPAFPKSVCGVVFQGQERTTGCQFTFACDGALARTPGPAAWERARQIARGALAGQVYPPVGYATHYHTDWVVPYWSDSLDKITAVGTHLFFRWRGWWGTPPAFRKNGSVGEPLIERIARFSIAHQAPTLALPGAGTPIGDSAEAIAAQARRAIGLDQIGKVVAGVRLIALADTRSFVVELPRGSKADSWPESARTFCAGRPQCRIMAWVAADAPRELPLTLANLAAMRFSYIHDIQSGLQRALWNCAITPRAAKGECMRQRVPVAAATDSADGGLAGVRRKERFETVTISPPSNAATNP